MSDYKVLHVEDELFDFKYISDFITAAESEQLIQNLMKFSWNTTKRTGRMFGNDDASYTLEYRNKVREKDILPWEELPGLKEIKERVEKYTKLKFTVCAIQYYHNGKIGIGAHKDKEIKLGECIVGLSLGATRIFQFKRYSNIYNMKLENGSLYLIHGITNKNYTHEIMKDPEIEDFRFSLTFRDHCE